MNFEWSDIQLGDFLELKRGYDLPHKDRKEGDYKVISSSGPSGFHSEGKVKGPGVVTGRYGTIGKVFYSERDFWPLNTTLYVKDFKGNHPEFVYYFLKTLDFLQYSDKAAVPGVNRNHLHTAWVKVPESAKVQERVAKFLSDLDRKITLNTQINQTLEQMAQALFKSWFVDFDPVIDNALEAGNPIPEPLAERAERRQAMWAAGNESAHARLPAEIRRLFPDSFEENEVLGWMPEGWKSKAVSQVLHINPKVKLPKNTVAKYADMKSIPTSGYMIDGVIEKPYSGGAKFESGDVLLARITPCLENGKTALVDFLEEDEIGFGSTEFVVMRGKGELGAPYVACLARWGEFRKYCIQSMVGSSGRQRIQNASFDSFYVALPENSELLTLFDQKCGASFRIMTEHRKQTETLTKLRDILLPKLLSGELQLPEAEAAVDTALEVESV